MRPWLTACLLTASLAVPAAAAEPDPAQAEALDLLHHQNLTVSYDALIRGLSEGKPEIVAAVLTAGLAVDAAHVDPASNAVVDGLATACLLDPVPFKSLDGSLSMIVKRGLPLDHTDGTGNTILMRAAQFCPAPVIDRLLALGSPVDTVNKQDFTPLQMALVSGKWDVAKILIDHGARVTRAQADQIFFEPPQARADRDLLQRAIR